MTSADSAVTSSDLARRLPWLLVFRAAVATFLLVLALGGEIRAWPTQEISPLLYGVVIGTYLVVALLGLLLRSGVSAVILSTVHLAAAVMAALMVVHATGTVRSPLSSLYLLAILDGAIIGGRQVALVVASAGSIVYGAHLVAQYHGLVPMGDGLPPPASSFISSIVAHISGFYLIALLAGHLAELWRREREAAFEAQHDLARAEAIHEEVLTSLPLGVLTVDGAGRINTANRAACRILDTELNALVGSEVPAGLATLVAVDDGRAEAEVLVADRRRTLAVGTSWVRGQSRDPLRIILFEDRTDVRRLERDLQDKQRLASLGELAAGIAHEIRNPLAAISGSVELLVADDTPASSRVRLTRIVTREIDRLNQLVEDFLIYARPAPPQPVGVDVAVMATDLCDVIRQDDSWGGRRVVLTAPDEIEAVVDPGQVRQLLWNLLRNALEASPEQADVELSVSRQGEQLCLEVRDRGTGIDPEIREHVFEPFRTTKPGGNGLGLAVVHRIVTGHGGNIDIESEPGRGTSVRVVLPMTVEGVAYTEDATGAVVWQP